MNWKHEAIEKLRDYEAKRQSLLSIPAEVKRLESAAVSIRSATADGTPVSGGGSRREDMLLDNISNRQELERCLANAKAWVDTVDKALAVLTPEQRLVLDRFYIHPERNAVDRLCGDLGVTEPSSVYRRKDKALRKFTLAMYGCTET